MNAMEPLVPGSVLGFRQFRLDGHGRLSPLFADGSPWDPAGARARCSRNADHQAPVADCTCGLHAWHHAEDAFVRAAPGQVVAAVRAHGRIVLGEHGFRAERAEVAAVCLPRRWSARRRAVASRMLRAERPGLLVLTSARVFRRRFPTEALTELGVDSSPTSQARNHRAFGVAWVLGVVGLYSVIMWPSGMARLLEAGGWVGLVVAVVAWQAWLVRSALA